MKIKALILVYIILSIICFAETKSIRAVNNTEVKALEALFPNSEIVKDQSFFITIGGFEGVYFISIFHYFENGQFLTFYIINDNKVLMELPVDMINEYAMNSVGLPTIKT